jgi:nucleoside-diphosphate-sugar epimerase
VNKGDFAPQFLQPYAETKALGEKYCRDACGTKDDDLLTIAVAPHQVCQTYSLIAVYCSPQSSETQH